MNTLRLTTFGLICALGIAPTMADSDDDCEWMSHRYGHMGTMGQGGPWMMPGGPMMGSSPGWMMGINPDILNDEYLDSVAERISEHYQFMQRIASEQDKTAKRELVREQMKSMHAYRRDDDDGSSGRDYRHGWMMGSGGMMDSGQFSDEYLDRIAERMAENYARMQQLAVTTDKAKRRELVREHLKAMGRF